MRAHTAEVSWKRGSGVVSGVVLWLSMAMVGGVSGDHFFAKLL